MPATINIGVVPVGIVKLPWGVTTTQQTVIPRYYNGTEHPAGTLEGWGPESILQGTVTTQDLPQTPEDQRWIVKTEAFGEGGLDLSAWQETVAGRQAAILQPILRNFTIAGYPDVAGYDPTNSYVNVRPNQVDIGNADLYGGFRGYGCGGIVDNVGFFYIPGTGLHISRPDHGGQTNSLPVDRLKWRLNNLTFRRMFRGLFMDATDSSVYSCEAEDCRDYGFRIGGLSGGIQFSGLHAYGCGEPAHESGGAGIWIAGGDNMGSQCYGENGPVGVKITGSQNSLTGFFSHTCSVLNVWITGNRNRLTDLDLRSAPNSIWIQSLAYSTNISNAYVLMGAGTGGVGLKMDTGSGHQMHGIIIDGTLATTPTGVDINGTLNLCDLQFSIGNCVGGTGIDLSGATIPDSDTSRIVVNTVSCTTPVVWPAGTWNTTPAARDYQIWINGARYYKQ